MKSLLNFIRHYYFTDYSSIYPLPVIMPYHCSTCSHYRSS